MSSKAYQGYLYEDVGNWIVDHDIVVSVALFCITLYFLNEVYKSYKMMNYTIFTLLSMFLFSVAYISA